MDISAILTQGITRTPTYLHPMKQPNVLYLHSHDTGRMVQPYGYGVATPHIQKFAEQSVLFRQAFCAGPTCSPSRAALLTGMYPHVNGMLGLAHRGFELNDYNQHIVHTFNTAGYETVLCGMTHEAPTIDMLGYQRVIATPPAHAKTVAPIACQFLAEKHDRPFFLSMGFFETHRPFPEPEVDARYIRTPTPIVETPETRRDMAGFATSARAMDNGFGMALDALDKAGLTDNTLVIMTTDHGPAFPGMKCCLTDHGAGVMLMIRKPGDLPQGVVVDGMVTHMDVFPTICELTGIPKPAWLQGESLLPLIKGDKAQIHDAIIGEVNFHAAYEPERSVRTLRHKYIRRFDGRNHPVLPNCDEGLSKTLWLEHGWANSNVENEYLFDLVFDPAESCNLAHDPHHAGVLADMRKQLTDWMKKTSDPLLDGPLYAPAGSRACNPNALEPEDEVVLYKQRTRM